MKGPLDNFARARTLRLYISLSSHQTRCLRTFLISRRIIVVRVESGNSLFFFDLKFYKSIFYLKPLSHYNATACNSQISAFPLHVQKLGYYLGQTRAEVQFCLCVCSQTMEGRGRNKEKSSLLRGFDLNCTNFPHPLLDVSPLRFFPPTIYSIVSFFFIFPSSIPFFSSFFTCSSFWI